MLEADMSEVETEKLAVALRALDELSVSLVEKAKPIRFSVAQSRAEQEAAYRLRYQALIDRGAARPEDFPDGLEHDEHDNWAIQVLGWSEGTAMATGRLVTPSPSRLLPTEQSFGLVIEPRGQVVDIGRFTVIREFAQKENRYFTGLLGFCWLEARMRGYIHVCGTAAPGMLRHYRRIGFIVTELAPPHTYYGEDRYPCRYDVVGSAAVLVAKWGEPNGSNPGG
jgi:N-acyl-L-homoserine lactone synthetase